MIGNIFFSTGITIEPVDSQWRVSAEFFDGGFCNQSSTEGKMRMRYLVDDPVEAAKTLKEDMEKLGIQFDRKEHLDPTVYILNDSDHPRFEEAIPVIERICQKLGWRNIYKKR